MMFDRHFVHWPPDAPHTFEVPRTSVFDNLVAAAEAHPERVLIDYYGSRLTYAEVRRQAEQLAGFLQARCGVRKGDRVLLCVQNSPQFIIGYYGILRADAVVVPVNPMNLTDELRHYVEDAGTAVAIVGQERAEHIAPLVGTTPLKTVIVATYADYLDGKSDLPIPEFVAAKRAPLSRGAVAWGEALAEKCAPEASTAAADDLAVMPYTSGTTGKPKGCMHTHHSVQSTAWAYPRWRTGLEASVVLSVLPMFHVTGMQGGMNGPIVTGSTIALMSRWDRDCAGMIIGRACVTVWTAITTMLVDFLSSPNLMKHDLSSLKVLGGGGAAMPAAFAQKLQEVIGREYNEGYGLTETMAPTHINPPQRPKRQCAGIPIFNTDARVIDVETRAEVEPHKVGEIIVRGPQVFRGYWRQPEATAEAFMEHDGQRFFRTGDLGYYDEEGYFFITDRLKRMINASGFKVWPAEVEALLYAHPDIQEACVIGARDGYRGETVKAVIVLKREAKPHMTPAAITDWARERMAAFKVPRVVEFVDELPKTATGKILWRKLQEEENRKVPTPSSP
jgi:fatty-acyl-CoA synthase